MNEDKEIKKISIWINIYVTVICLVPSFWLIFGLFNNVSDKTKIISTFASIPCLIIIGFIFGRDSRSREVYRLAKEADDLEEKLNYEKEHTKQDK